MPLRAALVLTALALALPPVPGAMAPSASGFGEPFSPSELADPFVLRVDGPDEATYYAYGTQDARPLPVLRSTDLRSWERLDEPTDVGEHDRFDPLPDWALPRSAGGELWAPAVLQRGSRFVLFVAARHRELRDRSGAPLFCIARAESASPEGVFEPTDGAAPFLCQPERNGSIDPSVFVDDGVPHLLWKSEGHTGGEPARLWTQRLTDDARGLVDGTRRELLSTDQPWEEPLIENPHMAELDGRYFLFYSGNRYTTAGYAVGYAECASAQGPCAKPLNAPFLAADAAVDGPGGSELFRTPDGRTWLVYHGWDKGLVGRTPTSDPAGPGRRARIRELRLNPHDGRPQLGDGQGTWAASPRTARVQGADRFETAAAFSQQTVRRPAPVVYLATGEGFADALAGAPAAGREAGAVLLTGRDRLPEATRRELRALDPGHVVILGGPSAIAPAVEQEVRTLVRSLHREAGSDRFDTAARVSANTWREGPNGDVRTTVAYLATGEAFPDALAAGAAGARNDAPVLLTARGALPGTTARELVRLRDRGLRRVVAIGGDGAIAEPVLAEVRALGLEVERVAGRSRFETAAEVARREFDGVLGAVVVATGGSYADAVAAGAFGAPVLLVPRDGALPEATAALVAQRRPLSVTVVGGPGAVSEQMLGHLR